MIIEKVMLLFILILIGYLARKVNAVPADIKVAISKLVLNITLPLYILSAMQFEFSVEVLKDSGALVAVSFAVYGIIFVLSQILLKFSKMPPTKKDIYQFAILFSNVGFMGYPIMSELAGDKGLFYTAIYNLSFNILIWTMGMYIMTRHTSDNEKMTFKEKIKVSITPSLVAVVLGFLMFLFSIQMPDVIQETFKMVGKSSTPLSMMFIGFILSEVHIRDIVSDFSTLVLSVVRLLLIPLVVYFVLNFFSFTGLTLIIPTIIAAMPVAANTAIVATAFHNDYHLASKVIFVSTLISIVTIPIIIKFVY